MKPDATLRNERTGVAIATRVRRANDPWSRFIGLLSRRRVAADEGLWISGCSAVHTLGMRATIDCYFLDRDDRVVKIEPGVAPGRAVVSAHGAKSVVELGMLATPRDVALGDRLSLVA